MAAKALAPTRIDVDVKEQATVVLEPQPPPRPELVEGRSRRTTGAAIWIILRDAALRAAPQDEVGIPNLGVTVLETMGLTVSDAVRIVLTRTAKEGALPIELLSNSEAHDAWFRAKVREALEDERPDLDDDAVEAQFAERRASALRKAKGRP